jgi:hypothetical protein|tara:strand:- start:140 stop:562 length:423 start_codon:yes stop_codon:yes gene_type:complete
MKGIIKDPTFDTYNKGGMVENRARPIDKEELMKLADADKEAFDFKQNLIDALRDAYKKEGSKLKFEDWIKTKDPDFLRRIELKDGGKIIDFAKYAKMKEPKVKKLNLASLFADHAKTMASLSPQERDAVNDLLKLTFKKD